MISSFIATKPFYVPTSDDSLSFFGLSTLKSIVTDLLYAALSSFFSLLLLQSTLIPASNLSSMASIELGRCLMRRLTQLFPLLFLTQRSAPALIRTFALSWTDIQIPFMRGRLQKRSEAAP